MAANNNIMDSEEFWEWLKNRNKTLDQEQTPFKELTLELPVPQKALSEKKQKKSAEPEEESIWHEVDHTIFEL